MLLRENCNRVENHVRKLVSVTNSKLSAKRGRAYILCANSVKRIAIRRKETQHVSEINEKLDNLSTEREELQEQNKCLVEYCEELCKNLTNVEEVRKATKPQHRTSAKQRTLASMCERRTSRRVALHGEYGEKNFGGWGKASVSKA